MGHGALLIATVAWTRVACCEGDSTSIDQHQTIIVALIQVSALEPKRRLAELFGVVAVVYGRNPRTLTMKPNVNTIERAFELARSGEFSRIDQIKVRLHQEGYASTLVVGKYLSAQLRQLMLFANPASHSASVGRTRFVVSTDAATRHRA